MAIPDVPTPVYMTLRLDVLSGVMKDLAESAHQARDGVTVRDVRLLLLVREHQGLSVSRLVELSFMEKTMASKAVTALTKAGLLERQISASDARQVSLSLTRKGRGVANRAHRYVVDATDALMSILTPEQRASFDETVGLLTVKLLQQKADARDLLDQPFATPSKKKRAVRHLPNITDKPSK